MMNMLIRQQSGSVALLLCACCVDMASASAGEVKVMWQAPENYTDIRPGNESRAAFTEHVTKELEGVFIDLAKKLPDTIQWNVTVTDLDLAGEVRPLMRMGGNDIRIVKDLYWPRMKISYSMRDTSGNLIVEGKDDIADMNFLMGAHLTVSTSSFPYEEKMLRTWFAKQQRDQQFPVK